MWPQPFCMCCLYCLRTSGSAAGTYWGRCGTPTNAMAAILLNCALFALDCRIKTPWRETVKCIHAADDIHLPSFGLKMKRHQGMLAELVLNFENKFSWGWIELTKLFLHNPEWNCLSETKHSLPHSCKPFKALHFAFFWLHFGTSILLR